MIQNRTARLLDQLDDNAFVEGSGEAMIKRTFKTAEEQLLHSIL